MPTVQYIGSDPTWGPQQQVARRHAIEQTSVTLGLADADPTVQDRDRNVTANPHQLRWRDSTQAAIGANQQWARKRLSTNELGLADSDPTVRPPWADGSAYLQPANRQPAAVTGTNAWARLRLNTNDLGLADADATVKPPWSDGEAFYWPAPRQHAAVTATNIWRYTRLTTNDLGTDDADPTIKPAYQDPHQRRHLDPAYAVQPTLARLRLRLNTNDLGLTDADPTIKPNWAAANPNQLRFRDPTYAAIEAVHQALRKRLTTNELGLADYDPTVKANWQAANPYTLRLGPSARPSIDATLAHLRSLGASTPVDGPVVTTTGCDHLNEDGGLSLNEDGYISLLESCPATETQVGSGPSISGRRGPYTDHNARKELLLREDDELLILI